MDSGFIMLGLVSEIYLYLLSILFCLVIVGCFGSGADTNSTMDMSGDTKFLDTKRQLRSTEDNMTTKLLNP